MVRPTQVPARRAGGRSIKSTATGPVYKLNATKQSLLRQRSTDMANQHSQTGGSTASTLLDATVAAFDQGQAASPQEGMSLITDWFSSIKNNHLTGDLLEPLTQLRDQLQTGAPDATKLQKLLTQLADLTAEAAPKADGDLQSRLETLATALRNFAGQFSTAV